MPTYEPLFIRDPGGDVTIPDIGRYHFRSPADVADFARHDATIGECARPEVWHLDAEGSFVCGYRGRCREGLRVWADDPTILDKSRRDDDHWFEECGSNWLIVENRLRRHGDPTPTELDAEDFATVRRDLASAGINLVDAVIVDDDFHWWSMHDFESPGQPYDLRADDQPSRSRPVRRVES